VVVRARVMGDHAAIVVSDDGIGIPEADQPKLFQRFSRGSEASVREIQGSGLGLYIVQRIVELHGGKASLHSVSGVGTDVTFTLPLAVPEPVSLSSASLEVAVTGGSMKEDG